MKEKIKKSNESLKVIYVTKKQKFIAKTIGLIGKPTPEAILLKTRFGIHTFFLRFPIDVIVLDKNNFVRKLRINLKPNRIFVWNPKFERIIELPQDTIKNKHICIGDKINIV